MAGSVGYEFANPPAAVAPKRAMYREPVPEAPLNIMHDPRVVRGNTYAAYVLPPSAQAEQERLAGEAEARRRRREATRRHQEVAMPRTPEPVDGRRHVDIQTENYLEELSDRVPEVDDSTQTEAFMDRPPSPLFIPTKTGVDAVTQIEAGELFDFDLEVQPILEVLVGKTLEQSMMEVLEEEELEAIRRHQEEFEQIRNAELAEVQRLEAEVQRKAQEKKKRMEQERARVAAEAELREKVAARGFAANYVANLQKSVFGELVEEGHFFDPLTAEVEERFMPWLLDAVQKEVSSRAQAEAVTESLIAGALALGAGRLKARRDADEAARLEEERLAEERRRIEEAEAERAAKEAAEKAAAGDDAPDGDDE
mmetsp:Transcript_15000/g.35490  ORF Transcript_15000/g.35490 Transcript_15000/m.35490 type:complete len:368 (+) Transcript_15000:178-1281(+)